MARPRVGAKKRVPDEDAGVSAPWEAWYHYKWNKIFYYNTETLESVWRHPFKKGKKREIKEEVVDEEYEMMEVDEAPLKRMRSEEEVEIKTETLSPSEETPLEREWSVKKEVIEEDEEQQPEYEKQQPEYEEDQPEYESEEVASRSATSSPISQIIPNVDWADQCNPYYCYRYRACAIYDTCSLLKMPGILKISIDKGILNVIPYTVLQELEGLKNDNNAQRDAMRISREIKELCDNHPLFIRLESSVEKAIEIPSYVADKSIADDSILRCGLRTAEEIVTTEELGLNQKAHVFITDDVNLSVKSTAHNLYSCGVESYLIQITHVDRMDEEVEEIEEDSRNARAASDSEFVRSTCNNPYFAKAVRAIHESRETNEWIAGMLKNAPEHGKMKVIKEEGETSESRPRPLIPLAEELEQGPSEVRTRTYRHGTPMPRPRLQKASSQPPRIAPKMPLYLSDDEEFEDEDEVADEEEGEEEEDGMDQS